MSWFIFALCTTLAWGVADLFYKKGADEADKYSHLKTTMWVGVVMGIYATYMVTLGGVDFHPINLIIYFPVSAMYILSMAIGYLGLRYLDLSISSPIQNASGAVAALLLFIFVGESIDLPTGLAIALICVGVFMLGVFEKQSQDDITNPEDKKYKIGFIAFMMPILYCIIDSLGTFFDGYYLDDITTTPLKYVTEENFEDVANVAYMYTFFIVAVIIFIFLKFVKKEKIEMPKQKDRILAAAAETLGQITYVYAISGNAIVVAPMISSYCIVSLILSRIFLKEKLTKKQYAMVFLVIAGILVLGIIDGINGDV
jgi:drug/metabolite transporter (DMT)-like permease